MMKSSRIIFTVVVGSILTHQQQSEAVQYFVDCDNGNDSMDGLSPTTAWRYPPSSSDTSNSIIPQPGDEIRIQGLCATSLSLLSEGTSDAPIRWIGNWPSTNENTKATFWGGTTLTSTSAQTLSELSFHDHLENLVVADLGFNSTTDDDLNVFQGPAASPSSQRLQLAQWPNPQPNPYKDDDLSAYVAIPAMQVTETSLQDSRLGVWQSLEGVHLLIWVYGNSVERRQVSHYNNITQTIFWEEPITPYSDRDSLYSLQGSVEFISSPGEYAVLGENSQLVAYPYEDSSVVELTVSVRTRGIDLKNQAYNSIENFQIVQYSGNNMFEGTAIYNGYNNDLTTGIELRSLTIRNNYKRQGDTVRLNSLEEPVLQDLNISQNANQRAIAMITSERGIITDNTIQDGSLSCFGCNHFVIADNTVSGDLPIHANGITVYQESHGTIVARNMVSPTSPSVAMTVKQSNNVHVLGNILHSIDDTTTFAVWTHGTDPDHSIVLANNYFSGRSIMSQTFASCTLVNNALGGLDPVEVYRGDGTIHHNMHHKLQWNQADKYDWTPFPDEIVATDILMGFEQDGSPSTGSPAIDAGDSNLGNLVSGLEQTLYSPLAESVLDYLYNDANGNARDSDGRGTDIGALEYMGPAPSPPTSPPTPHPSPAPTSPLTVPSNTGDNSLIVKYQLQTIYFSDSSGQSQPAANWRSTVRVGGCDGEIMCANIACKCFPEPELSNPSYHSVAEFADDTLSLDGSDYVLVPEAVRTQIVNLGQVTAGIWAKPSGAGYLFYQHKGISIRVDATYVYCNVVTTDDMYPNGNYRDIKVRHGGVFGEWHHFAVTFDGSQVQCFVDGIAVGSKPSTGTIPQGYASWSLGLGINPLKIQWGPNKALPMQGNLHEFEVYSRARSNDEVATWGASVNDVY